MDFSSGVRAQRVCPDCSGTIFVEDHAAGDIICKVRTMTLAFFRTSLGKDTEITIATVLRVVALS